MGLLNWIKNRWAKLEQDALQEKARRDLVKEVMEKAQRQRAEPINDVGDILSVHFEHFRADLITLDRYQELVTEQLWRVERRIDDLKDELADGDIDADRFDDESEEAAEALEEVNWRLEWIEKQRWTEATKSADIAQSGKWATFSYVDSEGVSSKRTIANWSNRGAYVVGYDRAKKAERTFRQDRISDWKCG